MAITIPKEEYFAQGHNACAGCGLAVAIRLALKAAGKDTIVVNATGCSEVVSSPYPQTAWRLPWIHGAFENASAIASGIAITLKKQGKKTNVLVFGGDGATFDIGLGSLSGALERGHKFVYVCLDNMAYMNCLSLDSTIMTEQGLKRVTEIKKGEKVYAFDEKSHKLVLKKCSGIFYNGIKQTYELNTLHHTIKATPNHPFLTVKRNGRGKEINLIWKTLNKLKRKDEIIILKNTKPGKSFLFEPIKISKKGDFKVNKINKVNLPKKSNSDLLEFLGLYVGDGWVREQKAEIGFSLPKGTKERKRLMHLCKKIFKTKPIQDNKNDVFIYSVNLARFINSLGFGNGAKNKIIPPWMFTLPQNEKEAFVKGLIQSDGYKIGKSYRYVSASYELLKTLRLLLQTTNYRVGKIHQQTKKKGTHCAYRPLLKDSTYGYICFSKKGKPDMKKYLSQIKQRDFLVDNEYFSTEKIISIKPSKIEPTIDLTVEGAHNFVADGIIVHNTGMQRSGSTPQFASTTTTPAGTKVHGKQEHKKAMPFIVAAHGGYTATATIAFPHDLIRKVQKGFEQEGPAYIQVYCPCIPGWKTNPKDTITLSKLAYETNRYPLFEIEQGKLTLTMKPNERKEINEYLQMQGRFKHLNEDEIKQVQEHIDKEWERLNKLESSQ